MTIKVAIIGRPNVGKSTLFNKLCGRKLAITHDRPGVTRDVKLAKALVGKLEFEILDTAGLHVAKDALSRKMFEKSMESAVSADLILFMVDGRTGVGGEDVDFANAVRKLAKPVILVVNKAENERAVDYGSIYKLGFEDVILLSAEHKLGFEDLERALSKYVQVKKEDTNLMEEEAKACVRLSVIGRPNAGKSTIFNKLLGHDRSIVSEVSGTTRDAIEHSISYKGEQLILVDTAGLRKRTAITDEVEQLSSVESINAIRRSHVVALVVDGTCPLEKQDFSILRVAINEGRGVVLVINKCDLLTNLKDYKKDIEDYIEAKLFELKGLPILYMSALKDKSCEKILEAAAQVMVAFNKKISTGALNKLLDTVTELHTPPLGASGRRIRLKYITQHATRPPTFSIFGNMVSQLPESYVRYVANALREAFELYGVPIRVRCKSPKNPYAKDA